MRYDAETECFILDDREMQLLGASSPLAIDEIHGVFAVAEAMKAEIDNYDPSEVFGGTLKNDILNQHNQRRPILEGVLAVVAPILQLEMTKEAERFLDAQ